jgi:hypothetical protein
MEVLLVLTVLVLGIVVVLMMRRKKEQEKLLPKNFSVKQARPRTLAPQPVVGASTVQDEVFLEVTELPLAATAVRGDTVAELVEVVGTNQEFASPSPLIDKEETTPEDSTLRRHYLSTRRAEKDAITNPYPTDSALRRHYDSVSAITLNKRVDTGKNEHAGQAVEKLRIPEDSALRRHFLAQLQAEIESHLVSRPTDSTLRRHYDSQVEAKMQEYLLKVAA